MPLGDLSLAKARQEELRREAAKRARGTLLTGSPATRWRSRIRRGAVFLHPACRPSDEAGPYASGSPARCSAIGGDLPSGRNRHRVAPRGEKPFDGVHIFVKETFSRPRRRAPGRESVNASSPITQSRDTTELWPEGRLIRLEVTKSGALSRHLQCESSSGAEFRATRSFGALTPAGLPSLSSAVAGIRGPQRRSDATVVTSRIWDVWGRANGNAKIGLRRGRCVLREGGLRGHLGPVVLAGAGHAERAGGCGAGQSAADDHARLPRCRSRARRDPQHGRLLRSEQAGRCRNGRRDPASRRRSSRAATKRRPGEHRGGPCSAGSRGRCMRHQTTRWSVRSSVGCGFFPTCRRGRSS